MEVSKSPSDVESFVAPGPLPGVVVAADRAELMANVTVFILGLLDQAGATRREVFGLARSLEVAAIQTDGPDHPCDFTGFLPTDWSSLPQH